MTMKGYWRKYGLLRKEKRMKNKVSQDWVFLDRAYSLDLFCGEIFRCLGRWVVFVLFCFSCAKTPPHTNTQIFVSCEESQTLLLAISQVREHLITN